MERIQLTERQGEVLRAIVLEHTRSAEPVGSRAITRKFRLGVSPATVRNVMVDLEDAGLVEQPHTSAGRVPTDRGYRLFVDQLMIRETPSRKELVILRTGLAEKRGTLEGLLERTSEALGRAALQLGIAVSPAISEGLLTKMEASPVSEGRLLLTFVFSSGAVRTVPCRWEGEESEVLSAVLGWINRRADGLSLGELHRLLKRETGPEVLPSAWQGVLRQVLDAVEELVVPSESERVHVSGTANIMAQPEFLAPERLRPIVAMMEHRNLLARCICAPEIEEGVRIVIGRENTWQPMQTCSLLISGYRSGSARGRIGVIGPTRMPYPRLVPLVERAAEMISRTLETM